MKHCPLLVHSQNILGKMSLKGISLAIFIDTIIVFSPQELGGISVAERAYNSWFSFFLLKVSILFLLSIKFLYCTHYEWDMGL